MADGYFVLPDHAHQVEMRTGLFRRTMATTDEVMLCEFFIERGTIIDSHSHTNDQVGYVIYGQLEIIVGQEKRICLAGDSYAIPGGIEHAAHAITDTLTISVFSPPRSDYKTEAR